MLEPEIRRVLYRRHRRMISLLFKRICLLLTICTALACTEAPEKAEEGGTCANSAECAEGQALS